MLETGTKIGPLENILNEKVTGYKYTAANHEKKLNGNFVLTFESGKKLFVSSMLAGDSDYKSKTILFFSPRDENI